MSYWNKVLSGRISRRRALASLGGSAAAAAFLAACGGDDDDDAPSGGGSGGSSGGSTGGSGGSSGGSGGSSSQDEIQRGGHLRIGFSGDLLGTDPQIRGVNSSTLWLIVDGLATFDDQVQPQPYLAESWEPADGGATFVFKLREGVKWHTGRDFTSEDVVWNIERAKNPDTPLGNFRPLANWFTTVETPDAHTVVLKSDSPRAAMFDFLVQFKMADRDTIGSEQVVGTGPWKWVEWLQGESMKWERNPEYWQEGKPYLDEITWQLPLDAEAALAHFESGALDVILNPAVNGFIRLQDDSRFQPYVDTNTGTNICFGFNTKDEPYNDPRVRQAFNWAIDRERLSEVVLRGTVEARSLPWPKNSPAYDEVKDQHYQLDLQKATDLLSAANATNLSLGIVHTAATDAVDFLPIWQEDLRSIGVSLELQRVESAAFPPIVNGHEHHSLWTGGVGSANGTPIAMFLIASTAWGGNGQNNTAYENQAYQDLIDQGSTELDPQRARAIYDQLNDMILESSNIIPVAPRVTRLIATSKLKGFKRTPYDSVEYTEAWLT